MTVTMSRIQKTKVIGGINCKIPATMWPLIIRVIAPNNQLVNGMIAKMISTIWPKPAFKYPFPAFAMISPPCAFFQSNFNIARIHIIVKEKCQFLRKTPLFIWLLRGFLESRFLTNYLTSINSYSRFPKPSSAEASIV